MKRFTMALIICVRLSGKILAYFREDNQDAV